MCKCRLQHPFVHMERSIPISTVERSFHQNDMFLHWHCSPCFRLTCRYTFRIRSEYKHCRFRHPQTPIFVLCVCSCSTTEYCSRLHHTEKKYLTTCRNRQIEYSNSRPCQQHGIFELDYTSCYKAEYLRRILWNHTECLILCPGCEHSGKHKRLRESKRCFLCNSDELYIQFLMNSAGCVWQRSEYKQCLEKVHFQNMNCLLS